jgi:bacillolysin
MAISVGKRALCSSFAIALTLLLSMPSAGSAGGLAAELGPGVEIDRHEETGKIGFIGTEPGKPVQSPLPAAASATAQARVLIAEHAARFGLDDASAGLRVTERHATPSGGTAVRLQQTYKGLPVLGGELVVNLDPTGDVLSLLGETSPSPSGPGIARVDASAAQRAAIGAVARAEDIDPADLTASAPELQIYDPRLIGAPGPFQRARAAWVLNVEESRPLSAVDEHIVVDAETGMVAVHFSNIAEAMERIVCDANNTSGQYPCVTPVRSEGGPPHPVQDVNLAFDYAGDTYDFYFDRFGLDSLDGAGLELISTVRYCRPGSPCPYANAFWDGEQMVYGSGFASADDVVGHEFTHGVTEFSSHLFYYQQSGAINESISDIFGEFIDLTNSGGTDTPAVRWLMGEDVPGFGEVRDMADPTAFDHPDRMGSPLYTADPNETDGGGVHANSGVSNKTAFLIADGDTFNGQTITALGIPKAALIYHTVNSSMLTSASDYADLANALRQACTNLIGTDGITAADCVEVDQAVLATEMDDNPVNSPTASPPACVTGSPSDVFSDDLETPASGNWTTGTIAGLSAWSYPQNPNPIPVPGGFDATYATSGEFNLFGYDRPALSDSFIRTTASVPIPGGAFARFQHAYDFEDGPGGAFDGGVVEYSTSGAGGPWIDAGSLIAPGAGRYNGTIASGFNNPLSGRQAFVRESNGYGASRFDLSSLSGENVMFRFRIGTDTTRDDFGWFIDDVRIYTCDDGSLPKLSIENVSVAEGDSGQTNANLTVSLDTPAPEAVGFQAATSNGTATQPADYVATSGPGSIAIGETETTVSVPVKGDTVDEPNETFNVALSSPTNATIADATGVVTITDDDPTDDVTPPVTTIDSKPPRSTTKKQAKFGFHSSEANSTFQCKLDQGAYAACSSPRTLRATPGRHTFRVRAIDQASNVDPTPASHTWKVKPRRR